MSRPKKEPGIGNKRWEDWKREGFDSIDSVEHWTYMISLLNGKPREEALEIFFAWCQKNKVTL